MKGHWRKQKLSALPAGTDITQSFWGAMVFYWGRAWEELAHSHIELDFQSLWEKDLVIRSTQAPSLTGDWFRIYLPPTSSKDQRQIIVRYMLSTDSFKREHKIQRSVTRISTSWDLPQLTIKLSSGKKANLPTITWQRRSHNQLGKANFPRTQHFMI